MTTPFKARRRKTQVSSKGKKKPNPDLKKKARYLRRLVKRFKPVEGKRLRIVFFGSVHTRSIRMKKLYEKFLQQKGLAENFEVLDVALHLSSYDNAKRIRLLKKADVIIVDSVFLPVMKRSFPEVYNSLKLKPIFKGIDEFNPSNKHFELLLNKSLGMLLKRH